MRSFVLLMAAVGFCQASPVPSLDCQGQVGELLPFEATDRALPAFPRSLKSPNHRTSCALCPGGKAKAYFYNFTPNQNLKIVGDTFVYFFNSQKGLMASRSTYVRSVVPPGKAGLTVEVAAPFEAVECEFFVDEETINSIPLTP